MSKKHRVGFKAAGCILQFLIALAVLFPAVKAIAGDGCRADGCHSQISDVVPMTLKMMQMIKQNGMRHGDPDGCVICHGGNPDTTKKSRAHKGIPRTLSRAAGPKDFYPDPGSIWIAQYTCGVCHPGYVYRIERSLMNTQAGIIQGSLHAWGIEAVRSSNVPWGNYTVSDSDGKVPMGTSTAYETYMAVMVKDFPDQFPRHLDRLPETDLTALETDPKQAAFTYQRQECQKCHIGVKGSRQRGDYRGMGCTACHMPYADDGRYQGNDTSISKTEPGHIRIHRIAGNRKTGGIPAETCNTCHYRGKRTGTSFLGFMESSHAGPYSKDGNAAPKRHGRTYLQLKGDLHHETLNSRYNNPDSGLLCQDCHTSMDVHGDGNLSGTTLAQVEIECTDCHGTPDKFPWELALGYSDEFGRPLTDDPARGVTDELLLSQRQFGFSHDPKDGFLLTARGNPFGNVVKSGRAVTVYSASGKDFNIPLLKQIRTENAWHTSGSRTAMVSVSSHLKRMECYTCHATWAPQPYGDYVRVDYSSKIQQTDWVASGNARLKNGMTAESEKDAKGILSTGAIDDQPLFIAWEDPVLGINGEGRISPLLPASQVVYTIIDPKGKQIALNRIEEIQIKGNPAGSGKPDSKALDTAPAQPHTNQRQARTCESCHTDPKTAGLGMGLPGLDFSRLVSVEGHPVAIAGSHWPLSRAFSKQEISRVLKAGVCIGCHRHMDNPDQWQKLKDLDQSDQPDKFSHETRINLIINRIVPAE